MDAPARDGDATGHRRPAVSIILPTYNRARFLPQAFEAIAGQQFRDWELIVVDDGGTDDTGDLVAALSREWTQPVHYTYQENQGAYGARNTGLDLAAGQYIAFYDSDDVWLPHHLQDCVAGLEANPEVDWVFGACRRVAYPSGEVLTPSTFYVEGEPRPFLKLRSRPSGHIRIVEDPGLVRCILLHGLYSGLQNSVIRRVVFQGRRFRHHYRTETEDGMFLVRTMAAGHRIAYGDRVHVIYHVHAENSSGVSGASLDKHIRIQEAFIRGYQELAREVQLNPRERRALDWSLSRAYFWNLGYALLWQNGRRYQALHMFRRGLRTWPWNLGYWKTYLLALLKMAVGPRGRLEGCWQKGR